MNNQKLIQESIKMIEKLKKDIIEKQNKLNVLINKYQELTKHLEE